MNRRTIRPRRTGAGSAAGRRAVLAAALAMVFALPTPRASADDVPKPAAPSAGAGEQTWYAQAVGRGERGGAVSHYWSKGPRFRAEIVVAGHRIVTIVNGEWYYTLDEVTGTGVAIRRSPQAVALDARRDRPFGNELEELIADGGERVGSQTLGGQTCDVYRLTDSGGRRSVCGDAARRIPIHVERYDRSTGQSEEVSYVAWLSGLPLPDRFFEPDPRFAIERLELNDYVSRSQFEMVGPAPVLFAPLLYGPRGR